MSSLDEQRPHTVRAMYDAANALRAKAGKRAQWTDRQPAGPHRDLGRLTVDAWLEAARRIEAAAAALAGSADDTREDGHG